MKAEIKIEISEVTPYDQVENVRMGICREIGGIRKIEYAELSRLKAEFARSFYQTIFDQFDKLVDFEEVAPNKFCGVMTIVLPKNKEKKMNLGSHNTFSYLPVRRWYMWPVVWTARCQKVNFGEQWLEGVRLFDLRLRFDKDGEPIICHGLIEFKSEKTFLDNIFKYLDYGWFRVVLETKKHDLEQERKFREYCKYLEKTYKKLTFFGGNNRADWGCKSPIYKFKNPLEDLDDKYSSTTSLFPEKYGLLRYVDDLFPIFYAWRYNHKNIEAGTSHKWLFIDFVDIK